MLLTVNGREVDVTSSADTPLLWVVRDELKLSGSKFGCGMAVNPNIVRIQMESGIIFGITAARYGRIDLEKGRVKQSNFHDYRLLSMSDSPEIEVSIIDSQESPTGVGEPGLPPVAAAIGNALFSATGQRLRELPLTLEGVKA
jgi:isoquinoline 1-oxidoreductase/isoquinoline 1-oxidoreductase beta subunit